MTTTVAGIGRAGEVERGDRWRAILGRLVRLAMIVLAAALVGVAIKTGREVQVLALAAAGLAFLLSLRWPLLPLVAFAVLVPFEQAVFVEGVGTLSRYAAIAFLVAYGVPRLGRLKVRAMPVAAWGYLAWAILSLGWAIDPATSLAIIPPLVLLFVVAVVIAAAVVEQPEIVRPLVWAYAISATATSFLGTAAYVLGEGPIGPNDRVAGLAGQDPAFFAAILLPAFVVGFYELLYLRWVVPSAFILAVSSIGILISGTRAAWLSAIVVVFLFVLPRLEPVRRFAALTIAVLGFVLVLQIPGVSALIQARTDTAIATGGAGRTDIWSIGLQIYESAPLTGVGIDNFPIANTPERIRDATITVGTVDSLANLRAHNIVISTLGELGIVGLLVLAAFVVPLLVRVGWGPDAPLVGASLGAIVSISLFLDMFDRKETWLFLALASGLAYLRRHPPAAATGDGAENALAPLQGALREPT